MKKCVLQSGTVRSMNLSSKLVTVDLYNTSDVSGATPVYKLQICSAPEEHLWNYH